MILPPSAGVGSAGASSGPPTLPPADTFFIGGPTASGKSSLAVDLAEATGAEIVGADAFQIYAGFPILSAQPSSRDRERVPHHLVGTVDIGERMDAARYQSLALTEISDIHARGKPAIVVGGTGLYIKTLTHGLSTLPAPDPILRQELEALDLPACRAKLEALDPIGARTIDLANPRRVIRALEIVIQTGKPLAEVRDTWESSEELGSPTSLCGVFVDTDRETLKLRIAQRTDVMFASGVVDEVCRQLEKGGIGPTANQMLGLREIERVCAGEWTAEQASEAIVRATSRYAKRQATWFKAQKCLAPIRVSSNQKLLEQALRIFEQRAE